MDARAFCDELASHGLNLCGAMALDDARHLCITRATPPALPRIGTLILCGSGGPGHWQRLGARDRRRQDGIEAAARRQVSAALPLLAGRARLLSAAEANGFDLRALAEGVGWGRVSPYLQLLIHPEFGPWVSIRAVVATDALLASDAPLATFDPCGPCQRPCMSACPVGAYRPGHAFDIHRCARHRLAEREPMQDCADVCHARLACPVGHQHAYGADELRHRHRSSIDDLRQLVDDRASRPEEC